jgi:hypothetical protein
MSAAQDSLTSLLDDWLQEPDDELGRFLQGMRMILIKHPIAAQAAFRALSAEGRRFAAMPEGATWKERLAGSELMQRGRSVWELATLNMLDEAGPNMLPTQYVDALCYAAGLADLEPRLARVVETCPEPEKTGDPA